MYQSSIPRCSPTAQELLGEIYIDLLSYLPLHSSRYSHPLPILNVSEHFTRSRIQNPDQLPQQVYGALLGTQSGRDIEIQNTFEILIKKDSLPSQNELGGADGGKGKEKADENRMEEQAKGVQVDDDFLKRRLAQCEYTISHCAHTTA